MGDSLGCLPLELCPVAHKTFKPLLLLSSWALVVTVFSPAPLQDMAVGRLVACAWGKEGGRRKEKKLMLGQAASK